MNKIYKTLRLSCLVGMLFLTACSEWVSITPSDRLSERTLFSTKEGFLKALNGIYVEMNGHDLYGFNLTAGALDAMGQYYTYNGTSTHAFYYYATHAYTNATVKGTFDRYWSQAYALIANANTIIAAADGAGDILPQPYLGLVKGEALALRAFFHFDLLRLFGPIYSAETQGTPAIPYMKAADLKIQPLGTAQEVIDQVIEDLQAALDLLKDQDPILTEGVRNGANPEGKNDFYYRQYRLNYYAVQGLLARVYQWKGQKAQAYAQAKALIESVTAANTFPWVTNSAATNASNPDRVFSTEVLFALYNSQRTSQVYDSWFAPVLDSRLLLTFAGTLSSGRVNELYDDKNDYRYRIWANYNHEGKDVLYHSKFAGVSNAAFNCMMPLIRLSEMYLIAAETCTDIAEANGYVNALRNARNCFSIQAPTHDGLMNYITSEFRKEMLGEGQMFFHYKRLAMQNIPNGNNASGNQNMSLGKYVVPLPDSEISQRPTL